MQDRQVNRVRVKMGPFVPVPSAFSRSISGSAFVPFYGEQAVPINIPPDDHVWSMVSFQCISDVSGYVWITLALNDVYIFCSYNSSGDGIVPGWTKTPQFRYPDSLELYINNLFNQDRTISYCLTFMRYPV
jgi:hypothetical protein